MLSVCVWHEFVEVWVWSVLVHCEYVAGGFDGDFVVFIVAYAIWREHSNI